MKSLLILICAVALVFCGVQLIYAQPMEAIPAMNLYYAMPSRAEGTFLESINGPKIKAAQQQDTGLNKMGDGVINATTFWMDVPNEVIETSEQSNIIVASTYGFGKGVVKGLARGAAGVADTATLGMLPSDKPLMEPEYKVKNVNEGFKVNLMEW